jgi:hypothetical protein
MISFCCLLNNIIMNRTEQNLDKSGISIAPPMRPRAVTQTIVPAPTQAPSTRVRKQEPSETEISDSQSSLCDDQQMEVDNVQLGDAETGRVGYDGLGEAVGDGDEGDYGDGDHGMGYDENMDDGASQHVSGSPLSSVGGGDASWPGDVGYNQHMDNPHAMDQDSDSGALWNPQYSGGAQYRAAAHGQKLSLLQVPKGASFHRSKDHPVIPLDTDAIVNHYDTPRKPKRGRARADSVESRQSKVTRRSASHSSAAVQSTMVSTRAQSPSSAIPSTKASTRPQSPSRNVSPVGQDFYGASRATGGVHRGRALGNNPNWADVKQRTAHDAFSKPNGKVLLYTSRDQDAHPAMMMMHETVAQLPPILEKLSRKFSPIRRLNSRIYVFEEDTWAVKGRFLQAILDDDPISWAASSNGKFSLSLLAVSLKCYHIVVQ